MWWSPDGRKIAYYRFDESKIPDYDLPLDHAKIYSKADIEADPKAGNPNPVVDVFMNHVASQSQHNSTCATAGHSRTRWWATTCTACRGRWTARSCCSRAPTAARTSWR